MQFSAAWPGQLQPDPGPARDLLVRELGRPEYQDPLLVRIRDWILDRLFGESTDSTITLPMALLVLFGLILAILLTFLVVSKVRAAPRRRRESAAVFDVDTVRTAAEHRQLADAAFGSGQWEIAIVEGMRAITMNLVERAVIKDLRATTVHELVSTAQHRFPAFAERLDESGLIFDETRYGDRQGTRGRASTVLDLEQQLRRAPAIESGHGSGPVTAVPR